MTLIQTQIAGNTVYYDSRKKEYISKREFDRRKALSKSSKEQPRGSQGRFQKKSIKPYIEKRPRRKGGKILYYYHIYWFKCRRSRVMIEHQHGYESMSKRPSRTKVFATHERHFQDHIVINYHLDYTLKVRR